VWDAAPTWRWPWKRPSADQCPIEVAPTKNCERILGNLSDGFQLAINAIDTIEFTIVRQLSWCGHMGDGRPGGGSDRPVPGPSTSGGWLPRSPCALPASAVALPRSVRRALVPSRHSSWYACFPVAWPTSAPFCRAHCCCFSRLRPGPLLASAVHQRLLSGDAAAVVTPTLPARAVLGHDLCVAACASTGRFGICELSFVFRARIDPLLVSFM